ncbi:MAG: Na(+)-translocating NADH-quinone reductase subunit A, partial [Massilibacteroides sp.]|nr:Na(+)-translocating NADH-quinone reductase subunit A [Massilibacteroides sp.]
MANVIKIKKGLDINLKGKAPEMLLSGEKSSTYAIVPDYFNGVLPKVILKVGEKVKAGTPIMVDKKRPEIKFVSPVSGELVAVNRGAKRKILSVVVKADEKGEYEDLGKKSVKGMDAESVKEALQNAGVWPFIRQRPYDIVASPSDKPRDIFVTAFDSAPLAPCFDFVVKGEELNLQAGIDALAKLTEGKVYVGIKKGSNVKVSGAEVYEMAGPHPAGNVGILINHTKPVNNNEVVWTVKATDVIILGRALNTGRVDFSRLVALTGSEVKELGFVKSIAGCEISSITKDKLKNTDHVRVISGNVLTGRNVTTEDYLGAYDNQITVIPEGDDVNDFFGWINMGVNHYSFSHACTSWLAGKTKEYDIDARIKGGKRAIVMSHVFDKLFPMDILPEYLLRATIAFDI